MTTRILILLVSLCSFSAQAIYTEMGANYSYKKSTYDSNNTVEQQSSTISLSLYFWEQLGIETSYTNGLMVKREKSSGITSLLTTTVQNSDIYGLDLIYLVTGKQSKFQPYLKSGVAYVKKRQVIQAEGQTASNPIEPPIGLAPSYGIGFKFFLTESTAIRAGYDVLNTPIDENTKADDISGRLGLSWVF